MLTGKEIIENKYLTETNLKKLVHEEKITALDQNFKPIKWERLEAVFRKIQELAETPGKKIIRKIQLPGTYGMSPTQYRLAGGPLYRSKEIDRPRLEVVNDIFLDENGMEHKVQREEWETLLSYMKNEYRQYQIPKRQYDEIKAGWGINIKWPYILEAFYEKNEVMAASGEMMPYLKPGPYYIPELAALVEAWMALYEERTLKLSPDGDPAPVIDWIKSNHKDVKVLSQNLDNGNPNKELDAYLLKILSGGSTGKKGKRADNLFKIIGEQSKNNL